MVRGVKRTGKVIQRRIGIISKPEILRILRDPEAKEELQKAPPKVPHLWDASWQVPAGAN
jgi:hypothetical protein